MQPESFNCAEIKVHAINIFVHFSCIVNCWKSPWWALNRAIWVFQLIQTTCHYQWCLNFFFFFLSHWKQARVFYLLGLLDKLRPHKKWSCQKWHWIIDCFADQVAVYLPFKIPVPSSLSWWPSIDLLLFFHEVKGGWWGLGGGQQRAALSLLLK